MRYLPSYDPAWSDGCTLSPFLPVALRRPFQKWMIRALASDLDVARKMRYACETHDMWYYFGGSVEERLAADKRLLQDWKEAGAPYMLRNAAYRAVRMWGGPKWRQGGVSWSYGGSYFRYGYSAVPVSEIRAPEAVQRIKPTLELLSTNAWPFKEERCECPNFTFLFPWRDDFDKGMICGGCGQMFTYLRGGAS